MSESKIKNIMAFADKTITLNLSGNCFRFFLVTPKIETVI